VTELKPHIDSTFSTKKDQANTFIAGSSMGGLISFYAICEYPDVFGGAACMSSHWPGIMTANDNIPQAFNSYLKSHMPSPKVHKIYYDYGTETLDHLYKPYQELIDKTMKAGGYSSANWVTREFKGENHSERAWQRRLWIPLEFLLGDRK